MTNPNVTGYNVGQHEALVAEAQNIASQMENAGQDVLTNFNALTAEGLQGDSADATEQLAQEFNQAMDAVNQAIQQLNQQGQNFGDNMQSTDQTFAGRISG